MATGTRLTIDDFERLPDEVAENHELVDGELVDVSGNDPSHNAPRQILSDHLSPWVREHRLGMVLVEQEYDFAGNAHGPDLSFFGQAKRQLVDPHKRVQRFVPDLAVEIASPSDAYEGLLRKTDRYLKSGTSEVWVISPLTRRVAIYRTEGARILSGKDLLESPLFPGFALAVEDLFEEFHL